MENSETSDTRDTGSTHTARPSFHDSCGSNSLLEEDMNSLRTPPYPVNSTSFPIRQLTDDDFPISPFSTTLPNSLDDPLLSLELSTEHTHDLVSEMSSISVSHCPSIFQEIIEENEAEEKINQDDEKGWQPQREHSENMTEELVTQRAALIKHDPIVETNTYNLGSLNNSETHGSKSFLDTLSLKTVNSAEFSDFSLDIKQSKAISQSAQQRPVVIIMNNSHGASQAYEQPKLAV